MTPTPPTAVCRSCGAKIIWTLTAKGTRMPVDAEPVKNGNLVIEKIDEPFRAHERGEVNNYRSRAVMVGEGDRVSHFATCVNADAHRKPRHG